MSNISEAVNPHQLLSDRTAVLAIMHQKERVMAPVLEREFGVNILVPAELDTDTFDTFTREVKHLGTQIEAARHKAQKALEIVGETLAFAREGTFGFHPMMPYLPANREIVILALLN